jgi:hypothetical protein
MSAWALVLLLAWWLTVVIDQPNWKASWLAEFASEAACHEAALATVAKYPGAQTECKEETR